MSSSINTVTVFETSETRTPQVVLSLLTALSSSFPALGKEGEAALSEQLSLLLQDKTMPVTELSLLYCYKFGYSISDVLKYVGFNGTLQNFFEQHDFVSLRNGLVSLGPGDRNEGFPQESLKVERGEDETATSIGTESTTDAESYDLDTDTDTNVNSPRYSMPWKVLGARIAAVLQDDEEVGCPSAPNAWHEVGSRIAAAFKDVEEDESYPDLSTSFFLTSGEAGEATLSEQLSLLLQDKTMPVSELSLLYCYKFGFSVSDALKCVGFNGKLQDFCEQHDFVSVHSGIVSLRTDTRQESFPQDAMIHDGDQVGCSFDPNAWHTVGSLIAAALKDVEEDESYPNFPSSPFLASGKTGSEYEYSSAQGAASTLSGDDETASTADTDSTIDAEVCHIPTLITFDSDDAYEADQEAESPPNPSAWRTVGCRIAAAFKDICEDECRQDSPDPSAGKPDEEAGCPPNPEAWCNVGGRIAAAFKDICEDELRQYSFDPLADEEAAPPPNPEAWCKVGCRIAAALKEVDEDDCCQESNDVPAWCNVGGRLSTALKQCSEVEECEDSPNPAAWLNVGSRLVAAFEQSSEGEDFDGGCHDDA